MCVCMYVRVSCVYIVHVYVSVLGEYEGGRRIEFEIGGEVEILS